MRIHCEEAATTLTATTLTTLAPFRRHPKTSLRRPTGFRHGLPWALIVAVGCLLALSGAADAADQGSSFPDNVEKVIRGLDADVAADRGLSSVLTVLYGSEYGTPQAELAWAARESISWGRIAVLSYLRATTGRGFSELVREGAHSDVAGFVARMEMSHDRMLNSLENLARMAARERNSRIFDRLRSSRRFGALPDLGAGFGLFQEALDFRQIGPASPTKIHSGPAFLSKGNDGGHGGQ
jgi:hypothetical protein